MLSCLLTYLSISYFSPIHIQSCCHLFVGLCDGFCWTLFFSWSFGFDYRKLNTSKSCCRLWNLLIRLLLNFKMKMKGVHGLEPLCKRHIRPLYKSLLTCKILFLFIFQCFFIYLSISNPFYFYAFDFCM